MIDVALGIADRSRLENIQAVLNSRQDLRVTVAATNSDDFMQGLSFHNMPAIAILDNALEPVPGLDTIRYFKAWDHITRSILIMQQYTPMDVMDALRARASILLEEDARPKDILRAICLTLAGKTFVCLRHAPWLQRTVGNWLGLNLLFSWKLLYREPVNLYEKMLKKGFKKKDIHSAIHKLMMAEIEARKEKAALQDQPCSPSRPANDTQKVAEDD